MQTGVQTYSSWYVPQRYLEDKHGPLAVKGNQRRLLRDLQQMFETPDPVRFEYVHTSESAHGREEIRECWMSTELSQVRDVERWEKLASVARITDTRVVNGKTTTASRYFISSLKKKCRGNTAGSPNPLADRKHPALDT